MRKVRSLLRAGGSMAALALFVCGPAWAQAADDSATASTGAQDGDIVVTAQKRSESVQQVPVAVSVVDPELLDRANIRDFAGLTRAVPSLTLTGSDQPVNASVIIRGIGTFAFSIGVEPSVAVQVDDVPLGFQARALTDLLDIERVEVLRGPQSTLYGQSASAGLINITTRDPSNRFSLLATALATTDREYRVGASISAPLSDTLGVRLTGQYSDFDGFVRNATLDRRVNGRRDVSLRGKLLWQPTADLAATVILSFADVNADCCAAPFLRLSPTAPLRGQAALTPDVTLPGVRPGASNFVLNQDTPSFANTRDFGQALKLAYTLDNDATLLSITSHGRYTQNDQVDSDRTAFAPLQNVQSGRFTADLFTQELRVISPGSADLRYVFGAFYGRNDYSRRLLRGPFFAQQDWRGTTLTENYAVFGQLDWTFLPGTTLTGGLRALRQDISYTFNDRRAGTSYAGSASDNEVLYKAGLKHEFGPDAMIYGSYTRGYKGQAFDISSGFNAARAAVGPIQPETSDAFEVGLRSRLLDRRLTFNLTGFWVNYDNFQAQGIDTIGGVLDFRLANVGKVRTRGVEAELNARVTDQFTLSGGLSYVDARIVRYPLATCFPGQTAAQGCSGRPASQNLAGGRLPNSPDWKFNAGFNWDVPLGGASGQINLAGNYVWQSRVLFALSQDPQTVQPSYGVLNLSAGWSDPAERYKVTLFVNNVFDKAYASFIENRAGNFGGQLATEFLPGRDSRRYGGIRLSLNY